MQVQLERKQNRAAKSTREVHAARKATERQTAFSGTVNELGGLEWSPVRGYSASVNDIKETARNIKHIQLILLNPSSKATTTGRKDFNILWLRLWHELLRMGH